VRKIQISFWSHSLTQTPIHNSPSKRLASSPMSLSYDSDSSQILSLSQDSTGEVFLNRENRGQVVSKLNETLPQRGPFQKSSSLPLGRRCQVQLKNLSDFSNLLESYRYMFTPLEERAKSVEDHLSALQEQMMASIELTELSSLGTPSQSSVWVCGRVCKDAEEGKINATSVILQGSRLESAGKRVLLNLTDIAQYSLFPGQIILVEGNNPSGREFYAKRILEGIPRPLPKTSPQKLLEYHHSSYYQNGSGLKVFIASGPFTTTDNLHYQPLDQLFELIIAQKPDLVLLIGPFVDSSQPLIQNADRRLFSQNDDGSVVYGTEHNATNELIFIEKILRDGLTPYFDAEENLPSNIVLVPSLQDAHQECVYPQPPFKKTIHTTTIGDRLKPYDDPREINEIEIPFSKDSDPMKRIFLAPNPCMLK
jgi:DNA polymerase alpha subunit B